MKQNRLLMLVPLCLIVHIHAYDPKETQKMHQYMMANYHQFGNKASDAHQWYSDVLAQPTSVYTYHGYIPLLFQTHKYQEIVNRLPEIEKNFAQNPDIRLLAAQSLKKIGKRDQADKMLIDLSQKFKTHPEIVFNTVESLMHRKEFENALALIKEHLQESPKRANNFIFYFIKAQIYGQLKKYNKAHKNIQKSLALHPGFDKGWLFLALLEEQAGRTDQAIEGYKTFLQTTSQPTAHVQQHLMHLTMKQNGAGKHNAIILHQDNCFQKALVLHQKKQFQQALALVEECIEKNPLGVQSRLLKVQILTDLKQYGHATRSLINWIDKEPHQHIWYQVLHLLVRAGIPPETIAHQLESIAKNHPNAPLPILYISDLYLKQGDTPKALPYLKKGLHVFVDPELKTRIAYQIALSYYEQEKYDDLKDIGQKAIGWNREFPPLLNLMAYYYATHEIKLDHAQKLMDRALKHDPHNPHFLDTQAVIWYKQGKYQKAHDLLQNIVKEVPQDATTLIHFAKTKYKLGHIADAKVILQKAQTLAKDSYEKRTIARLLQEWNK